MANENVFSLSKFPVHLGLGAAAVREPEFTGGFDWYEAYGARHESDGVEARLVSLHSFSEPWDTWEMHPKGAELVVCVDGEITLHQELDGQVVTAKLTKGQAIINPPGVWHTADCDGPCSAVFVTAGLGTQVRPR